MLVKLATQLCGLAGMDPSEEIDQLESYIMFVIPVSLLLLTVSINSDTVTDFLRWMKITSVTQLTPFLEFCAQPIKRWSS